MKIQFTIDYLTKWGQKLCVCGSLPELGEWDSNKAAEMRFVGSTGGTSEKWELEIEADLTKNTNFDYKYFVKDETTDNDEWEWGENREVSVNDNKAKYLEVRDFWRSQKEHQNIFFTAAFTNALMRRDVSTTTVKKDSPKEVKGDIYRFQIAAPKVNPRYKVCIIGSSKTLGKWEESKAVVMDDTAYPIWKVDLPIKQTELPFNYKYAIYDTENKKVVEWEEGTDRYFPGSVSKKKKTFHVWSDNNFRHKENNWRGTGVAIPVFSLRSKKSAGVGEFNDLKLLVDWAKKTGLKMVQVLPINDTIANHTWTDSYPYSAISVFALHPMYMNMQKMGKLSSATIQKEIDKERIELNKKPDVDYASVLNLKSRFFKLLFDEQGAKCMRTQAFKTYFENNKEWLIPYAAFSYLRDLNGCADFRKWKKYNSISQKELAALTDPKSKIYEHIAIHYFIQFHLDKQLLEATEYARKNGVVLKGDLPIGVYRHSVDAWIEPNLYNMNSQAGAPPDDFSVIGQNWEFPTYNWDEMAKDGYAWWRKRMKKLSTYFDALRIDHILGFFRIWEIPRDSVEGILGHFNPALALNQNELHSKGLWFDQERFCKPYIREHFLHDIFGEKAPFVKETFLQHNGKYEHYDLKPEFDTQRKLEKHFSNGKVKDYNFSTDELLNVKKGLFSLINEVLLLEAPFSDGQAFNPRISIHESRSYQELNDNDKHLLNQIYIDYFYKRHESFWRDKSMQKLPALKATTNMLICGEDLGMVPDCVPGVMEDLSILSLAIQRMPNDPKKEFWHPSDTPYLSVCSPSSHDMSTIRGWWEEDRKITQKFYNNILGNEGEAPQFCEPWICQQIIVQHLYSPSMWAVFPIQDLLAMEGGLRKENPADERINEPANPKHYWKYRFHMDLEDLLKESHFNAKLKHLVDESGRNTI